MGALIDNYSDEKFSQIVGQSNSMAELSRKLGYSAYSGDSLSRIRTRIRELNISTTHFNKLNRPKTIRNKENVFIENSTANQSTLRKWYLKGNYSPYICSICGQQPFWNGKEMTLILDHINGENHDDRLENLRWVCPNCNQQLPTTGGRNQKRRKKHYYCVDCGKEISRGCIRCKYCNGKSKIISEENMPIDRNKLKELIFTIPFTKIGKMFGVTDNAIRKWCKKFNLPFKREDIIKYSEEEWVNI